MHAFDQAECKVGINSGFSANHGFGRFRVALSRSNARGGLNFSFFLAGPLRPVLCHPKYEFAVIFILRASRVPFTLAGTF